MNIDIDFQSGSVLFDGELIASPGLSDEQLERLFAKIGGAEIQHNKETCFRLDKPLEWSGCAVESCVVLCRGRQCGSVVINIEPIALHGEANDALCWIAEKLRARSSGGRVEGAGARSFTFDWGRALVRFDAHYGAPTLTMEYIPGRSI